MKQTVGKGMESHAEIVRANGLDPAKDKIIVMHHEMRAARLLLADGSLMCYL